MRAITVHNVSKIYGKGHAAVKAVQDVTLAIEPGEIVLIMGPSGSGKTTLLSMIGTLLRPTEGSIVVGDLATRSLNDNQLADLRLESIGFIFQSFNLLSALTAKQNVMVPLIAGGAPKREAGKRAETLLTRLGLGERINSLPADLSGGEKQRVAIARALINEPKIILADEPTANLDSETGHEVATLLCEIACNENRAVVIVSHDPRLRDVAKRIYTIEDGKLIKEEAGGHNKICPVRHT
ncbi:MAG TPA: ABC transporter ATP-binding protein [Patescibacteria group bacterium]